MAVCQVKGKRTCSDSTASDKDMGTRCYPKSSGGAHYHGAGTLYPIRQPELWKRGRLEIGAGIHHVMYAKSDYALFPMGLNDVGALEFRGAFLRGGRFCRTSSTPAIAKEDITEQLWVLNVSTIPYLFELFNSSSESTRAGC